MQGNTEAWFHLGVMHLNGWGVPRNPGQAQYFFSMTAKTVRMHALLDCAPAPTLLVTILNLCCCRPVWLPKMSTKHVGTEGRLRSRENHCVQGKCWLFNCNRWPGLRWFAGACARDVQFGYDAACQGPLKLRLCVGPAQEGCRCEPPTRSQHLLALVVFAWKDTNCKTHFHCDSNKVHITCNVAYDRPVIHINVWML